MLELFCHEYTHQRAFEEQKLPFRMTLLAKGFKIFIRKLHSVTTIMDVF